MAAPLLLDMVLETSTNPGTASFVLNGAPQDRRTFASAASNGSQVFYYADDGSQSEWGVGILTVGSPNSISRQTIAGNTQNTTQALNFTGTVRIYSWLPASYAPRLDGNGQLAVSGLSADTRAIGKTALVPGIQDWGSYQAVGAKDADARYLRTAGNQQAVSSPVTYNNGLFVTGGISNWLSNSVPNAVSISAQFLAKAGSPQETSSPTTFGNGLTSSQNTALSSISAISGLSDITVNAGLRMGASILYVNSLVADGPYEIKVMSSLRLGSSVLYANSFQLDGAGPRSISGNTNIVDQWSFAQRPAVSGTSVALTSDLPVAASRRIEAFNVSSTDGARVNFPNGFGNADNLVINITCQRSNNRCVIASYENEDQGGFTLGMQREDTNGATQQNSAWTIHVTAIGNR